MKKIIFLFCLIVFASTHCRKITTTYYDNGDSYSFDNKGNKYYTTNYDDITFVSGSNGYRGTAVHYDDMTFYNDNSNDNDQYYSSILDEIH